MGGVPFALLISLPEGSPLGRLPPQALGAWPTGLAEPIAARAGARAAVLHRRAGLGARARRGACSTKG